VRGPVALAHRDQRAKQSGEHVGELTHARGAGLSDRDARVSRGEHVRRGLDLVLKRIAVVLGHGRDDRMVTREHRAPPFS